MVENKKQDNKSVIKNSFFDKSWNDGDFIDDVSDVMTRGANPTANRLFLAIVAFFVIFLVWSSFAKLDEVVHAEGTVVPSKSIQKIQNLEGGIVSEILVQEGDFVEKGDILIKIDDTGALSSFEEQQAKVNALEASLARLVAEATGAKTIKFSKKLQKDAPSIIKAERGLFLSRLSEKNAGLQVIKQQLQQKLQEYNEAKATLDQQKQSYKIAKEELDLTAPLLADGIVSKVDFLRLKRQVSEIDGEINRAQAAKRRTQAAINEVRQKIKEYEQAVKTKVLEEKAEKEEQYARFKALITASEDTVRRTEVRSPVTGTIKTMLFNTIGGVIQPAQDIAEIVPLEDTLLIEAKVFPKDIAFIRPEQKAVVKFSAYDYSIYGGLDANLEQISADSVYDERNQISYYKIKVRTKRNYIGERHENLKIIPGMTATVDLLTGKKTVMQYILKPVLKAQQRALTER
jgi:adhesin transport system membrane fusion protein